MVLYKSVEWWFIEEVFYFLEKCFKGEFIVKGKVIVFKDVYLFYG